MLYQINKEHEDWDAVSTAVKIKAAKDDECYAIGHIHVENGTMRATDTHCAVQAEVSDIWEDGFYIPAFQNQSEIWLVDIKDIHDYSGCSMKFPDFGKTFKDDMEKIISNFWVSENLSLTFSRLAFKVFDKSRHALNVDYIKKMPCGNYDVYTDTINMDSPVIFRETDSIVEIAIMVFRVDN